MNLRFLEKKDGKKILQGWNGEWKDIPIEKEQSILDKICVSIMKFEREHKKKPDGVMLGCRDYAELNVNMDALRLSKSWGDTLTLVMNVPVYERKDRIDGMFLMIEAQ